jgi:hypothetical protein
MWVVQGRVWSFGWMTVMGYMRLVWSKVLISLSQIWYCSVVRFPVVVLQRLESEAVGIPSIWDSINKVVVFFIFFWRFLALILLLAGHGGDGRRGAVRCLAELEEYLWDCSFK